MPGMPGMLKSLQLLFSLDFGFQPTITGLLQLYRDAREDARDARDAGDAKVAAASLFFGFRFPTYLHGIPSMLPRCSRGCQGCWGC